MIKIVCMPSESHTVQMICILNNNNSYLEFVVSAKHTLSNTYKVVSKTYGCSDVKFGIFESGKSVNVLKGVSENCNSSVSCARVSSCYDF